MVADALRYHKALRFRSSSTKGLTPADREKARAFPKLPKAPESFKRCFLHYLKTGTVLAEAKRDPGVLEVQAESGSGIVPLEEVLTGGSPQVKALASPFRGPSKRRRGRGGRRTGESTPQTAGRADGSPVRRSPSIDGHEVVPVNRASAYLEAECSSRSVSSLPELLRACEPQEAGQSGLSTRVGDSVGEGVTAAPNGAEATDPLLSTVREGVSGSTIAGGPEASPEGRGSEDPPNVEAGSTGGIVSVGELAIKEGVPSEEEVMVTWDVVATVDGGSGEPLRGVGGSSERSEISLAVAGESVSTGVGLQAEAIASP